MSLSFERKANSKSLFLPLSMTIFPINFSTLIAKTIKAYFYVCFMENNDISK